MATPSDRRRTSTRTRFFSSGNFTRRALVVIGVITLAALYSTGAIYIVPNGDAVDAGDLAKTFNDLVLSAAAIFFAFSFADARYWPTIGEAAAASYFYAWGAAVIISMIVDWTGTYVNIQSWDRISLILWFISSTLATLSLFRILRLGDPERLNSYLARNLVRTLYRGNSDRFMRAAREAVVTGADLTVRDLTDQLSLALKATSPTEYKIRFTAEFVSEITWAAFGGSISGLTAARTIEHVLAPETFLGAALHNRKQDRLRTQIIVDGIRNFVPILTRFDSQAQTLADDSTRHDFKVIATASLRVLQQYVLLLDPSPKKHDSDVDKFVLSLNSDQALDCLRAFMLRPTAEATSSVYSVYQHITGARYQGDYWAGSPILKDMVSTTKSNIPNLENEVSWIVATSLLSSTLPSVKDVLVSKLSTKDYISIASWSRIILSLGSLRNAEFAYLTWAKSVLKYRPRKPNPGDPVPNEFEISLGLAVLCLFRIRPWESSERSAEAKKFYAMFPLVMRVKLQQILINTIGSDFLHVDARTTARIRKLLIAPTK